MTKKIDIRLIAVWVVVCTIWGSTWAFIKIGVADLPPITFASARFLVAIVLLGTIVLLRRQPWPSRADIGLLVKTGLLQFFVNYALIFWAEKQISSGMTAVLQSTVPLFGFLMAHYTLHSERMTANRMAGLLIGMAGIVIIFSDELHFGSTIAALAAAGVLVSAIAVSYSNILVKKHATGISTMSLVLWQMIVGFVPLLMLALITEGNPLSITWTTKSLLATLYLASIGSVLAFVLYYWLVQRMKVTTTQLISLVTPVMAVIVGAVFLDEAITPRLLIGASAILLGIAVILWTRKSVRAAKTTTIVASIEAS
jgi:drug/metabolite transporter (DMT)-like permease